MNEQNWFALEILIDSEAIEAVEFALNELDSLGTEINNLGKVQTETICVIGYFNEKPIEETLHKHIYESLRIYGCSSDVIKKTEWRKVENKDWLVEWKKHWKPTETEKFIVAPIWAKVENTDKIVIRIEPSMAFGTGTHETTRLCLKGIEEYYRGEMSFFDVGTGTGILAIAAAKLKSRFKSRGSREKNFLALEPRLLTLDSISGCDTDEDSIKIAAENAETNSVSGEINFYVGSISEETPEFDFICANVTADVIIPMLSLLIGKSKEILVLSGILKEQEDLVVSELKKSHIANFKIETFGEWISIIVESRKW
ncbi:MAG: 50S ribosomal protein L11 methyltransferase [Acidobacteriota bacterium]|nr:50S ribosomal protein L11 methyltransferase [Acidobacteriota bacterium]